MHGDRAQLLAQVTGAQEQAKSQDEQKRAEVANNIQQIYGKTKTSVEARLTQLDTDVQQAFAKGADDAKKVFEDYVDSRMEAYKEERYSGVLGWGRWLKDKIAGMPSEVNVFYSQGRELYIARMDAVIDQVVGIVETGLAEAKAVVAQGRQEIQGYVASLPQSLQAVGQEAASGIQDQFNELEQSVDDKQNELIDTLAQQYNEKLQQVDADIEQRQAANQGLVQQAYNAVAGVIKKILQLKEMLVSALGRAGSVIMTIVNDPIGFLGNLVTGVKKGFTGFVSKIGTYLEQGLVKWLTGAIASAGIEMPDKFDLPGIFSLVMQVLGLTYGTIRGMAVKALGPKAVDGLEKTFDIFKVMATEGIAGLWSFVQDKIGDLKAMVMDQIRNLLIVKVIKAGIKWIIGLLNPAAAFIKACIAIYDIIHFIVTRGREIMDLVNAIIDSVVAIAKGNLSGAAKLVENALAKSVPVLIGFLASLLGLGGIGQKVRAIFETLRKPIKKAIGWVLKQAKKAARKIGGVLGFGKGKEGKGGKPGEKEGEDSASGAEAETGLQGEVKETFQIDGESHTLFAPLDGETKVEMASVRRKDIEIVIANALKADPPPTPQERGELETAMDLVKELEEKQGKIAKRKPDNTQRVASGEAGGAGKTKRGKPNIPDYKKALVILLEMIASTMSKVRLREKVGEKIHESNLVLQEITPGKDYLLDPKVDIRSTLYEGWWTGPELEYREEEIENNQKKHGLLKNQFICPECGTKYDSLDPIPELDHEKPVAEHWMEKGRLQTQDKRVNWYKDTDNLEVICRSCNRKKQSGGKEFRPIVGPDFRGPGEG